MELKDLDIPMEEVDLHVSRDDEGNCVARLYHRPTGTIKISDSFFREEEAVEDAVKGLKDLIVERSKGL